MYVNLNNYFNFHICLSVRNYVHLSDLLTIPTDCLSIVQSYTFPQKYFVLSWSKGYKIAVCQTSRMIQNQSESTWADWFECRRGCWTKSAAALGTIFSRFLLLLPLLLGLTSYQSSRNKLSTLISLISYFSPSF